MKIEFKKTANLLGQYHSVNGKCHFFHFPVSGRQR